MDFKRLSAIFATLLALALMSPSLAGAEPIEDTEPPQLLSLSIEPGEVDTTASAQTVLVTAHITDDLSGVSPQIINFASPSREYSSNSGVFKLISGTDLDGVYQAEVVFPRFIESGTYKTSGFFIFDHAGNSTLVTASELEERGFPDTVQVNRAPPKVGQLNPSFGLESGGTIVQISGSQFSGTTAVFFGSVPSTEFTVDSPTSITATAPPGSGTVDVVVTTPAGTSETSSADRFHYSPPVSLTSSPNPSVRGQKVTFTAKVMPQTKGAPKPLGTVAFVEDSTTLGVVSLNSKGIATFSTTALSAGEHLVVAEYGGDTYFGPSESSPVAQIVTKAATELTLKSSRNPAPFGASVTLSATVKVLPPGTGTPTGTVTFLEGGTPVATVPLSGKVAKYSPKGLSPGTHEFQAVYSGDVNYQASESAPLSQTITP